MLDDRQEQLADLHSIGAGAALELFGAELGRVLENIRDANTEAEGKRKIVLEFVFKPDANREVVATLISARSTLAATKPVSEVLFVGRKDGNVVGTVVHSVEETRDPRQGILPLPKQASGA